MVTILEIDNNYNKALISSKLTSSVAQLLGGIDVLEVVSSTNDHVMQSLQKSESRYMACIANQQTDGRGRDGKVWQSPSDANIYMSIGGCFESVLVNKINGLSLACGVAVARLLESMGLRAGLKWPNDILINDKKLAGILVETRIKANKVLVVVGIGLNVKMPGKTAIKIDQPWTDLSRELSKSEFSINRNDLAAQLLNELANCLVEYNQTGFASFSQDWKKFEVLTGRDVIIKTDKDEFDARVLGFDKDYGLRVKTGSREKVFYAADIKLKLNTYASN